MVKTTRRVKRSKKQVHRSCGRKTNRRRYTRRQRGGMLKAAAMGFAKFIGATKINPKGGLMFNGIEVFSIGDNAFHIGSRSLDEYDKSSDPNDKVYADKIRFYLTAAGIHHEDDMIVLDRSSFDKFKNAIDDEIEAETKKMGMNELRATERIIAFKNNEGATEYYPADKSKTEYNFGNFKINLGDSVRTGNLRIKFVNEETIFTLTLDVNASDIISCMRPLIDKTYVGVTKITSIESVGVFQKKLEVIGVLTENKDSKKKTFNL